jgi:hypothetical protein
MLTQILSINLWSPGHVSGWLMIVVLSLILGMVHGITPDEHTWPITFSYAIGSYSTKKGLKAGLIFSAAFTLQRAIASELAYLGLSKLYTITGLNNFVYVFVGLLMGIAGLFIVKRRLILHFDLPFFKTHKINTDTNENWLHDTRPWMPAVHGFVAGWGFGAFALILYTVLSPATHSAALGWVPGALFGVGTMLMQILAGALFGFIAVRKGLSQEAVRKVALKTAGNTLTWGGLAFIIGGLFGIFFPSIASFGFSTNIHIHNLSHIGLPFVLVIFSVIIVGFSTLVLETRSELKKIKHKNN